MIAEWWTISEYVAQWILGQFRQKKDGKALWWFVDPSIGDLAFL